MRKRITVALVGVTFAALAALANLTQVDSEEVSVSFALTS